MTLLGFSAVIAVFLYVFKEPAPVPFFMTFAAIQLTCMFFYAVLPQRFKRIARMTSMFLFGSILFFLAGLLGRQNFQLEGLFFYLTTGTLSGVLIHFSMAKVLGPLLYGRTWCSWGCWTTMFLELLPFKNGSKWLKKGQTNYRYIHFILSLVLTMGLFFGFNYSIVQTNPAAQMGTVAEMYWFFVGNILYYTVGIVLAIVLKDNRAFCKYICPLTVFLKTSNRIALLRIKGDKNKCTSCKTCVTSCPMSIDIPKYVKAGERVKSTECIMCLKCVSVCPEGILKASVGFDVAGKEFLK